MKLPLDARTHRGVGRRPRLPQDESHAHH
jgi:hypothetical protein